MTNKILTQKFFQRPALKVAECLLGKLLVCNLNSKTITLKINEVEVYDGFKDKASHAHKGKTKRNEIMFGPAGHFYVYLVYGVYFMLNVTTGPENYPAAILIRGAGEYNGPGKITKALKINKKLNGKLASRKSGLWFEYGESKINKKHIRRTPRIGVHYAGPIWAKKDYRFLLEK